MHAEIKPHSHCTVPQTYEMIPVTAGLMRFHKNKKALFSGLAKLLHFCEIRV